MNRRKGNVIVDVVSRDLCSGCGVCAGICPSHSLTMAEAPNGDLTSRWIDGPCIADCGLCLGVCPFADGVHNPRTLNEDVFGPDAAPGASRPFHEDVGFYDVAFVGHSDVNRPTSASGGLLTWTLERLLATGEVDRVGVVSCEADGTQGFRFVVREAQSIDETRRAAGSVYHQVEIADILRRIASNPDLRWAVTGVPCLCAAMRRAMGRAPTLRRSVRYLLGLACGMYQNTFYTELLLAESGVDRNRVTRIEYRGQPDEGSASNYRFRASDDRRSGTAIAYHGLPYYLGFNAFFRVNSCNSCMDVFAEGADACFMDAWLPEYRNEPRGTSLVLVRNPAIRRLLGQSIAKTGVCLNEIGIDKVIASQQMHVLRKRYLIHMRKGEKVNRFTHRPFALSDRVAWFVQRYAQRRSKNAWATAGRSRGHRAFWRAAWDVVLLVKAESCARRLARQLRALARLGR